MRQEILYLERKIKDMTINNEGDKIERRRLMKQKYYTHSKYISVSSRKVTIPTNTKFAKKKTKWEGGRRKAMEYDLNI